MNVRPLQFLYGILPALLAAWAFLSFFPGPSTATEISPVTDAVVDRIVIEKSKRTMTLLKQDREVRTYKIALGRNPIGPKIQKGDQKTPEGLYYVDYKLHNSVYHRALHLNYPNQDDIERARSLGVTPGNSIMIHGMKEDKLWMGDVQYLFDWTNGCIALTNREIEEVWVLVPVWTPVEIKP